MILNSIKLENIRSYRIEEIEFPRGITLLEGDIGSGKSSVLMGIEFALFGLGSQKPDALLSKKEEEGSVTLRFSVDGDSYEIKRTLKRKGDSVSQDAKNSYLKAGEIIEPLSPSELKQRVLQILKFNEPADPRSESRIFRYAFFTPQEEMKQILLDSAKRLETIRKAFGVEDYKIVAENAKLISQEIKLQLTRFEERFKNIKQLEDSLRQSNEKTTELDSQISVLKSQEQKYESEKNIQEKELEKLRMQEKEKTQLETQKENLEEKISDSKSEIADLQKRIENTRNELNEIADKIRTFQKITNPTTKTVAQLESEIKKFKNLKEKIMMMSSKMGSIEDRIAELQETLGKYAKSDPRKLTEEQKTLQHQIDEAKARLEKLYEETKTLTKEKLTHEVQKNNLENELAKIAKLGTKCPYCENTIDQNHIQKLEEERTIRLDFANKEISRIALLLAKSKKDIEELEEKMDKDKKYVLEIERVIPELKELSKKNHDLADLKQKLNEIKSEYAITREKSFTSPSNDPVEYLEALKDTLVEYQNTKKHIDELGSRLQKTEELKEKYENDLSIAKQKLDSFGSKIKEIGKKLNSFVDIDQKIRQLKSEMIQIDKRLDESKEKIATLTESLKNEKSNIAKLESDLTNAKKWQTEHQKYSNYHEWLREFFIPTLDHIEKQVLLSIQQQFDEIYKRWYSILIEDPTKESKIDENFTPIVEQDGYEQDVDFLSGGEKTSIALAYRLTLNSLMRKETQSMKSNLLILDEPTDGFSKTQLSKVKDVLQELRSEQIILVSHEKELETYVDNIFQISKEGGVSHITKLSN